MPYRTGTKNGYIVYFDTGPQVTFDWFVAAATTVDGAATIVAAMNHLDPEGKHAPAGGLPIPKPERQVAPVRPQAGEQLTLDFGAVDVLEK